MSTAKHTPTPWTADIHGTRPAIVMANDGMRVGICIGHDMENDANAERIAACVNACAGMEDPATGIQRARDAASRLYDHCLIQEDDVGMGIASAILRALGGQP